MAAEKDRAWQRYHNIRSFADSTQCRQRQICEHFGEKPKWETCGVCDVCSGSPAGLSEVTLPAARVVSITKPDVDEALREYLRQWRRDTARVQATPAFVVMHDTTLEEVCRKQPGSIPELLQITGFGERKAQMYGPQLFAALARYREGARASAIPKQISRPAAATKRLLDDGQTFSEIAVIRGRQISTIITSVAELIESGDVEFKDGWIDPGKQKEIEAACAKVGTAGLRPIKDAVSAEISYEDIRLVTARLRWEAKQQKQAAG